MGLLVFKTSVGQCSCPWWVQFPPTPAKFGNTTPAIKHLVRRGLVVMLGRGNCFRVERLGRKLSIIDRYHKQV